MEESMRQRLELAVKRLAEIDEELSSENVMKDMAHFRDISKERAVLDPQVEAFNQYKKMNSISSKLKLWQMIVILIYQRWAKRNIKD